MSSERKRKSSSRVEDRYSNEAGKGTLRLILQNRRRVRHGIKAAAQQAFVELGLGEQGGNGYIQSDISVHSICCGACQIEEMVWGKNLEGVQSFQGVDLQDGAALVKVNPRTKGRVVGGVNILDPEFRSSPVGDILLDIDGLSTIPPSPENLDAYVDLVTSYLRRTDGTYVHLLTYPASLSWAPKSALLPDDVEKINSHVEGVKNEGIYLLNDEDLRIAAAALFPEHIFQQTLRERDLYYLWKHIDQTTRRYIIDTESLWEDSGYYPADTLSYITFRGEDNELYRGFTEKYIDHFQAIDRENPYHILNAVHALYRHYSEYAFRSIDQEYAREKVFKAGKVVPKYPFGIATDLIITMGIDALQLAAYRAVFEHRFESAGCQVECHVVDGSVVETGVKSKPLGSRIKSDSYPTPITRSKMKKFADNKTWGLGRTVFTRKKERVSPVVENARLVAFTVRNP